MISLRLLALIGGAAIVLIATLLVLSGLIPAPAGLGAVAPWIGFGGAFLLFIFAIRSRKA